MRKKNAELLLMIPCMVSLCFASTAFALAGDVPDTEQDKCYDDTQEITCPDEGQPFYGQDAQYSINPHSYTALAGGIIVRDDVTGLTWEVKTDDGSIHDRDDKYTWQDAQSVFIPAINAANFGGFSDWRMPTVTELAFLVDRSRVDPSIDTTYFPNTQLSTYWSSTTAAFNSVNGWYVAFDDGGVGAWFTKSTNLYVRAVRGVTPSQSLVDNGNGTVTDINTGLTWEQKTDDGGSRDRDNTYTWQAALSYCEGLTLGGHTDWRLPNPNELQSIVDYTKSNPAIDGIRFPNAQSSTYWSSTTSDPLDASRGWHLDFLEGDVDDTYKVNSIYVRAVRGGKSSIPPVPALSQGGLIAFGALLLGAMAWILRRRHV